MNQILFSNEPHQNNQLSSKSKKDKKKFVFSKFQLILSIILFVIFIIILFSYSSSLFTKENVSNEIIKNYDILKLYSNNISSNITTPKKDDIFGIIEIPKINISYPIFYGYDDELLKISPCKISGDTPDKDGNLCIAGHNYNNSMFFSNISSLNMNDEIYIYDNEQTKYIYYIYSIYEVLGSDLSPIFNSETNQKELTLITCNNFNSKRIIVKAKQKSH